MLFLLIYLLGSQLLLVSVHQAHNISKISDQTIGDAGSIQGSHPWVKPKSVVCLGAPKTGVMLAFASGVASSWQLSVADVGVSQVVWRKYGTRRCNGVDFGNRWVVPLMYQPAAS